MTDADLDAIDRLNLWTESKLNAGRLMRGWNLDRTTNGKYAVMLIQIGIIDSSTSHGDTIAEAVDRAFERRGE